MYSIPYVFEKETTCKEKNELIFRVRHFNI